MFRGCTVHEWGLGGIMDSIWGVFAEHLGLGGAK
jgi:hypothetical protein